MATTPGGQPPGYYPDPQNAGGERWWDGNEWTRQTRMAPAPMGVGSAAATTSDSRTLAMFAHLSQLLALLLTVGVLNWVGPLIIYLVKRDDDPFVRDQAAEALNFSLSFLIYGVAIGIVGLLLAIVLIGFLILLLWIPLAIAYIVFVIIAAVRANSGEAYRYPLTIRFVN
jgi:uncharacterized protein